MVTACDSDDSNSETPGGGNGGTTANGPLMVPGFGGKLLTGISSSWDDITFNYSGRALMAMNVNDYAMIFKDGVYVEVDGDETNVESDFKLNKDGFITSFKDTWTEGGDSEVIVFNNKYSGRNLVSCTWNGTEIEDGEKFTYTYTITFNWENGNIASADVLYKDKYETEHDRYVLTYGDTPNAHRQYTTMLSALLALDGADYPLLGLFGDGPALLPTQCLELEDGDEPNTEYYTYTLNNDGTIATETEANVTTYRYHYSGEGAMKAAPYRASNVATTAFHKALRHHRHGKK